MTSQPRDKTRDSTKHDTAKFGIDLYRRGTAPECTGETPDENGHSPE